MFSYSPEAPITYTLELTGRCNQACLGCGNRGVVERNISFLSGNKWGDLLEKIRPYAGYIRLTGGECTLHPDFTSIVKYLDQLDIPFSIFTNAVWKQPASIIDLLAGLKNLSSLLVSLHGPDEKTHNAFTRSHFFQITIHNIQAATQAGITVDTNTVFNRYNWQRIQEITLFSTKLGARYAIFSRYYGEKLEEIALTHKQLTRAIKTVDQLKLNGYKTKLNPCIPECFVSSSARKCGAGETLCTIDPTGIVRPCNHANLNFGDLTQESITSIWSSENARYWRSLIPITCQSCFAFTKCGGGCRATALQQRLPADPLIQGSIQELPRPIKMYAGLRPIRRFNIRLDHNGVLLFHLNRVALVSQQESRIANCFDGKNTLSDLSNKFGQESLQLVATLYEKGLIELME